MNKTSEDTPAKKSSLKTLVIFCVVVILIIAVSLCYRGYLLVKNSRFDGNSGFIISVTDQKNKKVYVYGFDPAAKSLARLEITGVSSDAPYQQILKLPIDGELRKDGLRENGNFPLELTSYSLYTPQQEKDISLIDSIRLWLFASSIKAHDIKKETVVLPKDDEADSPQIETLFIDSQLEDDKKSITVVNGTSVSGLGGRLETYLNRIGGNVIAITTSHSSIPRSKIIYHGEKSYTVSRLMKILPYPVEQKAGPSLSDIIIEIGEDQQRSDLF